MEREVAERALGVVGAVKAADEPMQRAAAVRKTEDFMVEWSRCVSLSLRMSAS
jgi:hypothetical protein